MAFASRIVSKSTRQVCSGQSILRSVFGITARSFAKGAGNAPQALKGDGILRQEKITIDPENPAAVAEYAKVMKTVRQKADLFSESERIKYTIETRTQDIPDARSYLLALKDIRVKLGIRREDLPKYEEQLELKIAKAQLEELEKDALEAMETEKKREEFKDEEMPEVKSLDIRNFI